MKTKQLLMRIIPLLSNVKDSGVFNNGVATVATPIADELRQVAGADRIVVTALSAALASLVAAREFEAQQQAVTDTLERADELLDAIMDGSVEHADVVLSSAPEIIGRIVTGATGMRDVFAPRPEIARSIRADAAELSAIVEAEVITRDRGPEDAVVIARLYAGTERLASADFAVRDAAIDEVLGTAARLAA